MYKHSTTHRTLSRRLAALLAVLALLAAMTLPVYAEALDDATQMQETVETDSNGKTDNKVETGSDDETDDKSETNEGTGTGTDTDSDDTNDNASQTPGANSTAPADNAAADNTAPYEEKTDLTEEDTADGGEGPADEAGAKETFFAADTCSEDETGSSDMSAPMAASNEGETTTIYFAVDRNYKETYRVNLYVQKKDNVDLNKDMSDTGKKIRDSDGTERKIFSVTLSQADYPGGGFDRLIFQYFTGTQWECDFFAFGGRSNGDKAWTSIDKIAGKMYDGQKYGSNPGQAFNENQWTRVEYAGMPLYFKNASGTPLDGVTATFYKKDENGNFVVTGSQTIGTVAAGTIADQKITIPDNQSQFVKFTWTGSGEDTLYYNFSNEECSGITKFDLVANNCFVYSGSTESPWQNAGSDLFTKDKTIYFDATLSSYAYTGDSDIHQKPMPGKDGTMYCYLADESNNIIKQQMTLETADDGTDRQLWSCTVPEGGPFTAVQFSAHEGAEENSAVDALTKQYSTAEIPPNLKAPCFFADDGDPSAYTSGNDVCREGYWDEKDAIRDAESGKGTTVVDIASDKFTQEAGTKYITSTLYDYYTDYELNGFNRNTYPDSTTTSQRGYVTFEQFNRALSSAYTNGNVKYPLYTGHFQPSIENWGNFFAAVAPGMGLYGWGDVGSPAYKTFMAVNNSVLDTDGNGDNDSNKNFYKTFQGLVEDKTSDGKADGLPLLKRSDENKPALVDPHFNKDFLQGKNTFNTVLGKVYEDVSFPLKKAKVFAETQDGSGNNAENDAEYWYFDSNETSLYLKQDSNDQSYYLAGNGKNEASHNRSPGNGTSENNVDKGYGFFPFNEKVTGTATQYNYGFGAKLQFDFTLTSDGQVVVGNNKEKVPIKFFFSGDDDVWVYIDGELVLDVGGAHSQAAGLLEFGSDGNGQNTVTSWVSDAKTGGQVYKALEQGKEKTVKFGNIENNTSKPYTFKYKTEKPKPLKKQPIHTLTMYYMERGMWESNMAVAFNFPDHNELQVEKQVDVSDVNPLFQNSFLDQKIFTFNIQNLATHYGETKTTEPKIETKELPDTAYSSATGGLSYEQSLPNDVGTGSAVLWKSDVKDPTSEHRDKRRGTLAWDTAIDITKYSYLTFDVYVKGDKSETCALSNLYVELWDDTGNKKMGCLGTKGLRSSDVYGAATALHPGTWYTVRLMLNSLQKDDEFNNQVTKITVGDNFARSIYLRNFTFSSAPTMPEQTGFTTAQYDIPDYGSAKSGNLENAAYAVFSSSDGTGNVVNENGDFLLEAGETVTFNDQFRRGSYIALKELTDTELYDTSWTVCENGVPVTHVNGNTDVVTMSDNRSLQNVKGTTPNDGRTEQVVETSLDGKDTLNAYKVAQKPEPDTLVFRSYSDKADPNELTKLKVVFTNKVKTGKLVIRKVPADGEGEQLKNKTFTFTVQFGDVGGQSLGDEIPLQTRTCKVEKHADGYYGQIVIDKIPVGTRFVVSEIPTEGTSLKSVHIEGGKDCATTADGMAYGTIAEGDEKAAKATFENTARELIDITVNKVWLKQDNTEIKDNLPTAIYLRLQRTETPDQPETWQPVAEYNCVTLQPEDYNGWTKLFTGLDKYDANKPKHVDYTYRVLESATGKDNDWHGGADDNVIEIDGKKYTILNNTVQVKEDSTSPLALNLTNKQQDPKFTLDVTKKSAENDGENDQQKLLAGVEFTLEKMKDDDTGKLVVDGNFNKLTGMTNAQGVLMLKDSADNETQGFKNLEAGTYRLTETKAAKDYNLLSAPIVIIFTKDGQCQIGDDSPMQANENEIFTGNAATGYTLALTVLNRKTPALPHTGADAPSLWLLIGLPLAVAGLLILVFRYNKKGGRTR